MAAFEHVVDVRVRERRQLVAFETRARGHVAERAVAFSAQKQIVGAEDPVEPALVAVDVRVLVPEREEQIEVPVAIEVGEVSRPTTGATPGVRRTAARA